jgi:hypothetical protein
MYGLGLDKIKIEEFITERKYQEFVMKYIDGIYQFTPKSVITEIEYINENGEVYDTEPIKYNPIKSTTLYPAHNSEHELNKLAKEFDDRRED